MILSMLCLVACERSASVREVSAVIGAEPIPSVIRCEESTDVFLGLAEKDRRDITLLHVSSRDNLSPLAGESMADLRSKVKKKQWDQIQKNANMREGAIIDSKGYLFAAARLGFVKEVYWMLPSKLLEFSDVERRVQMFLSSDSYRFDRSEIAEMHYQNGCVSGTLSGVVVHICSVETLPAISEAVTLDVDAGFFPPFAEERNTNVMGGMKEFFDQLSLRKIAVREAYVRLTQREGTLSPLYLHLAGNIEDILRNPSLLKVAPPEPWRFADGAAAMLSQGLVREATILLKDARKKFPDDTSLAMLNGIAASLGGNVKQGLDALSALCEKKHETCYSLGFTGGLLRKNERNGDAQLFYDRLAALRPDL